jgi:hypothetical protein
MSDYWTHDIEGNAEHPRARIRQFNNGSVQIYQASKYGGRHGKTIYLSADQFKLLRNHLIEEME